jgi:PD-(D/E)XK nuclease superfamily protein
MLFGRAFEKAVAAYFRREDAAAGFFTEWSAYRDRDLAYSGNDSWDRFLQEGFQLLDRFVQEDRVRIPRPRRDQQIKFTRPILGGNEFVAYIDAIGRVDGTECLIEWKTTSARYPEEPAGLLALDPQLVCYSWITGISEVTQVVFVRKRLVEVQYLRTSIREAQRQEFAALLADTVQQIDAGRFLPHSGIRFPQNPCLSCAYVGLCLAKPELAEAKLVRRPGGSLVGVFDELTF